MAWNSFSETLSSCSLPGMQLLSTSGSLSFAQTTSRLAGSWTCPFMVIAIGLLRLLRSRYKALVANGESAFLAALAVRCGPSHRRGHNLYGRGRQARPLRRAHRERREIGRAHV